jgi:hypothetical protein
MAGFASIGELVDDEIAGAGRLSTWRKTVSVTTGSGFWFDLSMSPGNPVPQYYASAPLVAQQLGQAADGGIFHGGAVSPERKYLRQMMGLTVSAGAVPLTLVLLDYLLFYPFIDEAETAEQAMTNTLTLPRSTDGKGVKMMLVVVAGQVGGQTITVNYTNSDGVAGRTSKTVVTGTQAVNGTILTSAGSANNACAPFVPMQDGDVGVRSVQGVTTSGGDVGLFTLALVKPLATFSLRGIDAPCEVDYLRDFAAMPRIEDDAYLNFICLPMGSLSAAPIHGMASFVWG